MLSHLLIKSCQVGRQDISKIKQQGLYCYLNTRFEHIHHSNQDSKSQLFCIEFFIARQLLETLQVTC